jgi:hypothetical protein
MFTILTEENVKEQKLLGRANLPTFSYTSTLFEELEHNLM